MTTIIKDGPSASDVHVDAPLGAPKRKPRPDGLAKTAPVPLYVQRKVKNADELIAWAKGQGLKTTLPADDLHTTITYSRRPVDWMQMGQDWGGADDKGELKIAPGGPRVVDFLGPKGALVLFFASSSLAWRHQSMVDAGASYDFEQYQPHITLTYDAADIDPSKIEPYRGQIVLGPEIFQAMDDNWSDSLIEKAEQVRIVKMDDSLGLVFGWAIVCKVNGEPYYDLNVDLEGPHAGQRVPEHVPEETMMKAAADFMETARPGNEMHVGEDKGTYVFAFPMTTDIAKAMGIQTATTGLMIAYKPPPSVYAKFKDGTYRGFSIEGSRIRSEEQP